MEVQSLFNLWLITKAAKRKMSDIYISIPLDQ